MDLSNIPAEFRHLFREQDDPIDFAKAAAEKNRQPTPEIRAAFNERQPDFADMTDLLTANALGLPTPTFVRSLSISKSATSASLAKRYVEERGVTTNEARHALMLADYYKRHAGQAGVGLTDRLEAMIAKALPLLCDEDGEELTKAARALDMGLVAFYVEKALGG